MYNKNEETRIALSRIYNVMRNSVAARMFRDCEYGMPATTRNIKNYTPSKKIYYTNLRRLIKANLIHKDETGTTYKITALGCILLWADDDMTSMIENDMSELSPDKAEAELKKMSEKVDAYHRHKERLESICEEFKKRKPATFN